MRLLSESVIKNHLASGGGFENVDFVLWRVFLEMLQVLREIPGWRKEVVLVWEQCLHANKLVWERTEMSRSVVFAHEHSYCGSHHASGHEEKGFGQR